jgi:hypothetical protein
MPSFVKATLVAKVLSTLPITSTSEQKDISALITELIM